MPRAHKAGAFCCSGAVLPETRTVAQIAQIDRDLAELRRRRIAARVNGEIDLIIVLSQAINRSVGS